MTTRKPLPIKMGLLRNQVRKRIFEGIMGGPLRPGDTLRELDLARDLRVSQATSSIRDHIENSYQGFLDSEWEDFREFSLCRGRTQ